MQILCVLCASARSIFLCDSLTALTPTLSRSTGRGVTEMTAIILHSCLVKLHFKQRYIILKFGMPMGLPDEAEDFGGLRGVVR